MSFWTSLLCTLAGHRGRLKIACGAPGELALWMLRNAVQPCTRCGRTLPCFVESEGDCASAWPKGFHLPGF